MAKFHSVLSIKFNLSVQSKKVENKTYWIPAVLNPLRHELLNNKVIFFLHVCFYF